MKTVCKKLLCLMLVAIMLVSAVPAAFAAELITRDVSAIVPVGPGTQTPAEPVTPPVEEPEEGPSDSDTVTATLTVFNSDDETVASKGAQEFTRADMKDIKQNGLSLAADLLDIYDVSIDASLVKTVAVFGNVDSATSFQILMTLKAETNPNPNPNPYPNPNPKPNTPVQPDIETYECKLYIDYNGHATNRTQTVTMGTKYLSVVGEPARPGYNFMGWYSDNLDDFVNRNDKITSDDTITAIWEGPLKYSITFDVNRKGVEQIHQLKQVTYGQPIGKLPVPNTDDYVFMGWIINGKKVNANTIYEWQGDVVAYAWWEDESIIPGVPTFPEKDGNVYLEIYANGDTGDLVKRVNITAYAKDGYITLDEAKAIAAKNVVAKNGYTLKFDGLFNEENWWWYCRDRETDGSSKVKVDLWNDHYVYIMVKNVKKAVADSSNPKTGDSIMIAATTMSLSAAALVSIIELKKRKMI